TCPHDNRAASTGAPQPGGDRSRRVRRLPPFRRTDTRRGRVRRSPAVGARLGREDERRRSRRILRRSLIPPRDAGRPHAPHLPSTPEASNLALSDHPLEVRTAELVGPSGEPVSRHFAGELATVAEADESAFAA